MQAYLTNWAYFEQAKAENEAKLIAPLGLWLNFTTLETVAQINVTSIVVIPTFCSYLLQRKVGHCGYFIAMLVTIREINIYCVI